MLMTSRSVANTDQEKYYPILLHQTVAFTVFHPMHHKYHASVTLRLQGYSEDSPEMYCVS